ncbi:NuoM family protein [Terriglobus sp. TAA 43]|uniref:complex I subunit 4 family protein n=1 Tax=Terriglobus sp. TAA 43 TaxID=278961 RepID=UPI00064886C8|nr:NADH-quinone oxidoreductase subunit M [Terriglobus sp. TAA 43]
MTINDLILTLILLTPLAGVAILALLPQRGKSHQWVALIITLLTFVFTLHLPVNFHQAQTVIAPGSRVLNFAFEFDRIWIPSPIIHYHVGVDGLSMWLIVLSGLLAPLGVLASWRTIASRQKLFYSLFLLQQVAILGLFMSLDLFLFYAFFELALVPMTLLIAIYGRTGNRQKAAMKYFLYNFIPSAILLVGVIWIYAKTSTFQIPHLLTLAANHGINGTSAGMWLASLAFLIAFAVKIPIFPLHGWLSDAISEAPTAAVMILAGKIGLYSLLRFSFGIFPEQSHRIAPLMIALGAIGIVYGACVALIQDDLKRLAAFSTLGHLSFITLGIFTFTVNGLDGGMYQILNHGISGGALFLLMGFLYERYGTYDMRELGGIAGKLPWMVTLFVITALSNVGLPMLNSFVGEFLILSGTAGNTLTKCPWLWTTIATSGVIFAAAYLLTMIQRVFYANLGATTSETTGWDITPREHLALWPLVALFLYMGLSSPTFTRSLDPLGVHYSGYTPAPADTIRKVEAETYSQSLPANTTAVASAIRTGDAR